MNTKNKRGCNLCKVFVLPLVSVLISYLLVLCLSETSASIIVGADSFDARHLYYNLNADQCRGPLCDEVIIYDPFNRTIVSDMRLRLAEELLYISKFKPKAIVFDHLLPYVSNRESDSILVAAVRQCLAQDIVFITPQVRVQNGVVLKNFFDSPQYSLNLIPGDFYVPIDRIGEYSKELLLQQNDVLWVPELVYSLDKGHAHPDDFYRNKYINFDAPPRIQYYYRDFFSENIGTIEPVKQISGRIVLFSAYSAGDDLHDLKFAIRGVGETEQEVIKTKVSGAELLWYSVRDALKDNWDTQLHICWVLVISWILTCLYCCCIRCLYRRRWSALCKSILVFIVFVAMTIIVLPIVGGILMCYHLVLPMAIPAISLVLLNVFYVDSNEKV